MENLAEPIASLWIHFAVPGGMVEVIAICGASSRTAARTATVAAGRWRAFGLEATARPHAGR
jgi:hypothetical protein